MGFWDKAKGAVVTEKKEEVIDLQAKEHIGDVNLNKLQPLI